MGSLDNTPLHLQLGDIIEIISPMSDDLDKQTFIITYIDEMRMQIANNESNHYLKFNSDGSLSDENIENIYLLQRHDEDGFARQNGLISSKWVDILFSGDVISAVTGQIVSVEEDMIEVRIYPFETERYIFIDFGYSGLRSELNIQTIKLREPPQVISQTVENKALNVEDVEEEYKENNQDDEMNHLSEHTLHEFTLNDEDIHLGEQDDLLSHNADNNGQDLGEIEQVVKVIESEQRYGISVQASDLLNNIISKVDVKHRTNKSLKYIQKIVERFLLVRETFSVFDDYNSPKEPIYNAKDDFILKTHLYDDLDSVPWFRFTSLYARKSYGDYGSGDYDDEHAVNQGKLYDSLIDLKNNYGKYTPRQLDQYMRPYVIDDEGLTNYIKFNNTLNSTDVIASNNDDNIEFRILPEDKININGYLTLTNKYVEQSAVHILGTSIYDKVKLAPLNKYYVNAFRDNIDTEYINKQTLLTANDEAYDKTSKYFNRVLSKPNRYVLDSEINSDIPYDDKLRTNMNVGLPSNFETFLLVKDKLTDWGTNLHALGTQYVMQMMALYTVREENVNYNIYKGIKDHLYTQRNVLIRRLKTKQTRVWNNYTSSIKQLVPEEEDSDDGKKQILDNVFTNMVVNSPTEEKTILVDLVRDFYTMIGTMTGSLSELLQNIKTVDDSTFLSTLLSYANVKLMSTSLETVLGNYKTNITDIEGDVTMGNKCDLDVTIAKRYLEFDEMVSDNNTEIYFDKVYDKTFYGVLDIYETERNDMTQEQFFIFLKDKLSEVNNISSDESETMASTIVNGKKIVLNGHFCILETIENELIQIYLYKRINDKWVLDEQATKSHKNNFSLVMDGIQCDQTVDCNNTIPNSNNLKMNCEDIKERKQRRNKLVVDQMMNEFKHIYHKNESEIKESLKDMERHMKLNIIYLRKRYTQYFKKELDIALFFQPYENIVISPHTRIRDQILGNTNIKEKYADIIFFIKTYTREPHKHLGEKSEMYYCISTDTELLPRFYNSLANAFQQGFSQYQLTLDFVQNEYGTLSDDGNSCVDKHSGFVISERSFEMQDDYYTVPTTTTNIDIDNDPLVSDDEQNDLLTENETMENLEIITNHTPGKTLIKQPSHNFRTTLATPIDELINYFESTMKFAFSNKIEMMQNIMVYHETHKSSNSNEVLGITIACCCFIVIELQLQYTQSKMISHEGSPKSFIKGYPVYSQTDDKTINYITSLLRRTRVDIIKQSLTVKEEKVDKKGKVKVSTKIIGSSAIGKVIKRHIQNIISDETSETKLKIDRFTVRYIQEQAQIESDRNKYAYFKPHIRYLPMPVFQPISKLPSSSDKILDQTSQDMYSSKLGLLSAHVVNEFHNIVRNDQPILQKSTIYTNNFCCFENISNNIQSDYFITKSKQVSSYLTQAKTMSNSLLYHHKHSQPQSLESNVDTKQKYPMINTHFNNSLITSIFSEDNSQLDAASFLQNKHKASIIKKEKFVNKPLNIILKEDVDILIEKDEDNETKEEPSSTEAIFNNIINEITTLKDKSFKEVIQFNSLLESLFDDDSSTIHRVMAKVFKKSKLSNIFDIFKSIVSNDNKVKQLYSTTSLTQTFKSLLDKILVVDEKIILDESKNKQFIIPDRWKKEFSKTHIDNITRENVKMTGGIMKLHNGSEEGIMHIFSSFKNSDSFGKIKSLYRHIYFDNDNDNNFELRVLVVMFVHAISIFIKSFISGSQIKYNEGQVYIASLLDVTLIYLENTIFTLDIDNRVLRAKEDEKNRITKRLREMEDDEREVDTALKNHKLGKWGRGLDKSIFQYDKDVFDAEYNEFQDDFENNDLSGLTEENEDEFD